MVKRPVKARPAALDRAMPVGEAFRALLRASLAQLRANERGMLGGRDPEYLHQMRVALRRMRSVLAVFAPFFPGAAIAPLRAELKWVARRLGTARDWDVFATQTQPLVKAAFGSSPHWSELAARCDKQWRAAGREARRVVRSARYRHLVEGLAARLAAQSWPARLDLAARAALQAPVVGYAGKVLERRCAQVHRRGRNLTGLPAARLHRLRIAIKKFRYAADSFAGLYDPRAVRAALQHLSGLQDILGAMNDAATASMLIRQVCQERRDARSAAAWRAFLGWRRNRMTALKGGLESAWREFRTVRKFW